MKASVLFIVFVLQFSFLHGQLSSEVNQYMVFQPLINPASMASYSDVTFCGHYRNQWGGFDGAPETFSFSSVFPISSLKGGIGLELYRDKIGANKRDEISLSYAYRAQLNQQFFLSFSLGGKLGLESRDLLGLPVNQTGDVYISSSQNQILPNSVFGTYLFSRDFYFGFVISRLFHNNYDEASGLLSTGFSAEKLPLLVHLGKEINMQNKHTLNFSTLVKTSYGTGVHAELNAMYQVLNKRLGLGVSYRTSNDLVGIIKIKPTKELIFSYGYQMTFSSLSSYQNGSHEIMLVYGINKEKKIAKLYAPRF